MLQLALLGVLCVVNYGAMIPVETIPNTEPEMVLNKNRRLPAPELEDLLHFAIRHSNLTRLRELAESGSGQIERERFDQLVHAMEETERMVRESVNKTLIYRSWETEDEFISAIQLIQDYGDHLVDKGDMLHKLSALEPLLDWLVSPGEERVRLKLMELAYELSQNREPTKLLILQLRPRIVESLFAAFEREYLRGDQELGASILMVMNALVGNNDALLTRLDESVFSPLSKLVHSVDPNSPVFARLLSTFKLLSMTSGLGWISAINPPELLVKIPQTKSVSVAAKLLEFVQSVDHMRGSKRDMSHYRNLVYRKCIEEKGTGNEWCEELKAPNQLDDDEL